MTGPKIKRRSVPDMPSTGSFPARRRSEIQDTELTNMHAKLPCLGIACNVYRLGRRHAGLNSRSRIVADDPLVDARIAA